MNVVGKIGEFIIKYQYPIEIALLSVLAVIILYALIKAIVKNRKDKNVLSQINSTVSDINNTVSSINDKQAARMEKEPGTIKNNISVSKDIPSVKVSYVVSDDDYDRQTTVSIDHGYIPEEKCTADIMPTDIDSATKNDACAENVGDKSVFDSLQNREPEESIEALIKNIGRGGDAGEIKHRDMAEAPKVFASRECATDKYGNIYTEEQLSEQIK